MRRGIYHPLAATHGRRTVFPRFMFDDRTEQDHGAATRWQCRACRRELPCKITEYIDPHSMW